MTQGDLAAMVGAIRVRVNRQLSQLRDAVVPDFVGRKLAICLPQELILQASM